jgi:hypothetical protein
MTWSGFAAAAQQIASKLAPTPFGQKQIASKLAPTSFGQKQKQIASKPAATPFGQRQRQIASKPAATPFGQKRTQVAVRSASGRRPWEQSEVTTVAMGCAAALKMGPMVWVPLADAAKV